MRIEDIRIRRLLESEWNTYRALRLDALRIAPGAFGTKLADVIELPDCEWQLRSRRFANDPDAVCFVAFSGHEAIGMVSCFVKDFVEMVQMWVEPNARGKGVGGQLVEEVKLWAKKSGHNELLADVFDTNTAALKLYKKLGFIEVDNNLKSSKSSEIKLKCKL